MAEGDGLGLGADAFGGFGIDAETDDITEAQQQAIVDALTGKGTQEAETTAKDYGEQVGKNVISLPTVTVSPGTGVSGATGGASSAGSTGSSGRGSGTGTGTIGGTSSGGTGGSGAGTATGGVAGSGAGTSSPGTSTSTGGFTGSVATGSGGESGGLYGALSNAVSVGGASGAAMATSAVKAYMAQALQKAIQNDPQSLPPNSLERVLSQIWQASRGAGMSGETTFGHMMDFTTGFVQGVIGQLPGGHELTLHMETPATIAAETFNTIGKAIGPDIAKIWGFQQPKDWMSGGVFGGSPDITDPTPWGRADQAIKDQQAQSVSDEITAAIEFGRNPISMNPMVTQSINPDTRTQDEVIRDLLREIDPQLQGVGPEFEQGFTGLLDDRSATQGPAFAQLGDRGAINRSVTDAIDEITNLQFQMDPDHLADIERGLLQQDRMQQTVLNPKEPTTPFDEDFLLGPNTNVRGIMSTQNPLQATDPFGRSQNISDPFGLLSRGPNDLDDDLVLTPEENMIDVFANFDLPDDFNSRFGIQTNPIAEDFELLTGIPSLPNFDQQNMISAIDPQARDFGVNPLTGLTDFQSVAINNPNTVLDPSNLTTQIDNAIFDVVNANPNPGSFDTTAWGARSGPGFDETGISHIDQAHNSFPTGITNPFADVTGLPGVNSAISSFDVGDPSGGRGISTGVSTSPGGISGGTSGGISGGVSGGISGDPSGGLLGSIAMGNPGTPSDPGAGNIPPDLLQQMIMQGLIRV